MRLPKKIKPDRGSSRSPLRPELLSAESLAKLLDLGPKQVHSLASHGLIPPPVTIEFQQRWRLQELYQWIDDGCKAYGTPEGDREVLLESMRDYDKRPKHDDDDDIEERAGLIDGTLPEIYYADGNSGFGRGW